MTKQYAYYSQTDVLENVEHHYMDFYDEPQRNAHIIIKAKQLVEYHITQMHPEIEWVALLLDMGNHHIVGNKIFAV